MHVDNCLRELRIAAGLTQADVAADVGVTRTTVLRWEKRTIPIADQHKLAVAKLLNVTPARLMGWDKAAA